MHPNSALFLQSCPGPLAQGPPATRGGKASQPKWGTHRRSQTQACPLASPAGWKVALRLHGQPPEWSESPPVATVIPPPRPSAPSLVQSFTLSSSGARAFVGVDEVNARPSILAGLRKAFVDLLRAVDPMIARNALQETAPSAWGQLALSGAVPTAHAWRSVGQNQGVGQGQGKVWEERNPREAINRELSPPAALC